MSLIKCPECAREISDKAATCPQCGVPLQTATPPKTPSFAANPMPPAEVPPKEKSYSWMYLLLMVGGIFGAAVILALLNGSTSAPASSTPNTKAPPALDAKALADFETALAAIKAEGGFTSIELVGNDQVWISVAKPFQELTFDNKRAVIAMVYHVNHAKHPSVEFVVLKDAYSNKTIGRYSPTRDLKLE